MDVREKLVELLKTNACPSPFICDQACKYYGYGDCFPYRFADHLIANGVTVQEWISVDDRLPEPKEEAICIDADGDMIIGTYTECGWMFPCYCKRPTHWMPLPQPPKGE